MSSRKFELDIKELIKKKNVKEFFAYLKENKDTYFIAFRTQEDRITVYYKGQEAMTINIKNSQYFVKSRRKSIGIKNNQANIELEDNLLKNGFKYYELEEITEKMNLISFLKINTNFLDKILSRGEKESQGRLACFYQNLQNHLLCLDMEYNVPGAVKKKANTTIEGRYDLIFLKEENKKFKIVFSELKSLKTACTNPTTGILNHIDDMNYFIDEYRNNKDFREDIIEGFKFALTCKQELGFIDNKISLEDIDFEDCSFWITFYMIENEKEYAPKTIQDYYNIIKDEIAEAIHIKEVNKEVYKTGHNIGLHKRAKTMESLNSTLLTINGKKVKKYDIREEDMKDIFSITNQYPVYVVNNELILKEIK